MRWRLKCIRRKSTREAGDDDLDQDQEFSSSLDMSNNKDKLQLPLSLEMLNMDTTQEEAMIKFSFFSEEAADL